MSFKPSKSKVEEILKSDRFERLLATTRAQYPEESKGGLVRWAFIRHQGWPVTFDMRFAAPNLPTAEKNALNYAYSLTTGAGIISIPEPFGALDYISTATGEIVRRTAEVLPSAEAFAWFARNAKYLALGAVVIVAAPHAVKLYKKTVSS